MPTEIWFTYVLVAVTFLLVPGPTILLVISYSLLRGRQAILALVLGVGFGDISKQVQRAAQFQRQRPEAVVVVQWAVRAQPLGVGDPRSA